MLNFDTLTLVYQDEQGNRYYQPGSDIIESGTLIDPDTGDDMPIIGYYPYAYDPQDTSVEEIQELLKGNPWQ